MTQLQPMPDGETLISRIAMQKRLENQGYFLVGLKGDLNAPLGDDEADATDGSFGNEQESSRIVLRTVQVKVIPKSPEEEETEPNVRRPSLPRVASGSEASKGYRRLRAIIYAHRPFIYCFLFEANTSSLSYTAFYRTLRQNLMPIHKPLLSSTNAAKVAQRIENSHLDPSISSEAGTRRASRAAAAGPPSLPKAKARPPRRSRSSTSSTILDSSPYIPVSPISLSLAHLPLRESSPARRRSWLCRAGRVSRR